MNKSNYKVNYNKYKLNYSNSPHKSNELRQCHNYKNHQANADSGTTGHFISIEDGAIMQDVKLVEKEKGITVEQPDGSTITSIATGKLPWTWLPEEARTVHIFESLTGSLLSIGLLCDAGYEVTYNKQEVKVTMEGQTVITGKRINKLWMIDLQKGDDSRNSTAQMIANANHAELVKYAHLTMGAPTLSTFMKALKKGYINPPGVNAEIVRKNPPNTTATAKGHLNLIRQGIRSTKEKDAKESEDEEEREFTFPSKRYNQEKFIVCTLQVFNTAELQKLHVDLAGKFPYSSSRSKQYWAIFYSEETNYIHIELLATRSTRDILQAYLAAIEYFDVRGIQTKFIHMDGETSHELEKVIKKKDIKIQFCPPSNHRALKAERAIQTTKNHAIASFCTTDPNFPMKEYDLLVPQIELTLNLMRGSPTNPSISAWHHVHGPFNWASTPIAPIGTKVVIHERANDRGSWAVHGKDGFYIGPKLNHYRCYEVLVTDTGGTRTSDTVAWYPAQCVMPGGSYVELITEAIKDLTKWIQQSTLIPATMISNRSALNQATDTLSAALKTYKEIFQKQHQSDTSESTITTNTPSIESEVQPQQATDTQEVSENVQIQRVSPTLVDKEDTTSSKVGTQSQQQKKTRARPNKQQRLRDKKPQSRQRSPMKSTKAILNHQVRPKRIIPNRTFADGVEMIRPKKNERGHKHTIAMLKEVAHFNHQAKALRKAPQKVEKVESTGRTLNFRMAMNSTEKEQWIKANDEEFQRFKDTGTMNFIQKSSIPKNRTVAYYNPQVKVKSVDGTNTYRVRGTIGGDKVDYPGLVAANTADLKTIKLLINSVISTPSAKFMTIDIKDFYLGTILPRSEYMRISINHMSRKFAEENNLTDENGYYYVEIVKGIYGLPQAGLLAQKKLIHTLQINGYNMCPNTPCLFKHESRKIAFTLVVDDFGIKYESEKDVHHLISTLEQHYKLHIDWTGTDYVGLALKWEYEQKRVSLSMPGYVKQAIERFGAPDGPGALSPMIYEPPKYGKKIQYAENEEEGVPNKEQLKRIQQIVGVFLYYARAIDYSILTAITTISTRQKNINDKLLTAVERMLSYINRFPDAKVIYEASKMELITHADASYLSETGARSRAGGIMWLGDSQHPNQINGAVTCICKIIDTVVASAAEAEYAGLFILAQEAEALRIALEEMGHKQKATTVYCDNACAVGIANDTVKQKRSKALDMRFHWVRDRVRVGHFTIKWIKGIDNLADFFTKPLPAKEHQVIKRKLVHSPDNSDKAQAMRIK
jgi:hypothetical protein